MSDGIRVCKVYRMDPDILEPDGANKLLNANGSRRITGRGKSFVAKMLLLMVPMSCMVIVMVKQPSGGEAPPANLIIVRTSNSAYHFLLPSYYCYMIISQSL